MNPSKPHPEASPSRGTYAWFEALSAADKREYIEQYGCPPAKPGARSFPPRSLSPYRREIGR